MAIDGLVKAGSESYWGIAEEATFGTAIADDQNFVKLEGPIPTVDEGITRVNTTKFNGMRMPSDTDDFYTQAGGLRIISFSDLTVRRKDLADFLYAVRGVVSEGAATPFQKDFTWTSSSTQPDYSASAGYFCTLGIVDPIAAKDRKFTSCILRSLTLNFPFEGDGRITTSGEFISGFASSSAATFSGTWAYNTANYIQCMNPAKKLIATNDIVLYGMDITINNNAVRVGATSAGHAETYFLGGGDAGLSVTGNILTKFDTSTEDLIADSRAGTHKKFEYEIGTDGAAGFFDIYLDAISIGDADKEYGDAKGQAVKIPFTAIHKTGAAQSVFQIADVVDRAW